MEISSFLLRLTKIALNALVKFTNAELRIHGEGNIHNQPILYVINHFTRMETFFLPYVINKTTGKEVLSLAFQGLFGGSFGKLLHKVGAISTDAPDRDKIFTGALLTGDYSCLIFPEGQMVKDKKLIEKGKYMVYNSGIRRPPHTGAAIQALRSEFYREKLRYFKETGFDEGIREYSEFFGIDSIEKLEEVLKQETNILPVNITYFPLRSRRNIINEIVAKFVDDIPERLDEELALEGTMIVDGVDIDINFGKPIRIHSYLDNRKFREKIRNNDLYLNEEVIRRDLRFRKEGTHLMYRYMDSIYGMTTVNCEHIFSYILTKYKSNKILESDFRNRAFLAIDEIKKIDLEYNHSLLKFTDDSFLKDFGHVRYNNYIEAIKSESLISVENGTIIKNADKFSKMYKFHTIRKDNIVEVMKNEIEPLRDLVKILNRLMRVPDFIVRRRIRNKFLKLDKEIFEKDYSKFYIEGETKPKEIGQPFFLKRSFSRKGVLLIHGYLSAPEEVRELADYLYSIGYTVYGVRLRGHGTAPEDLASRSWEEWFESVNRGSLVLRNTVDKVAVVGFSTGAGLGLLETLRRKEAYSCMVSINAPLRLSNIASRFASAVVFWNHILEKMNIQKGKMEYVTNEPENPHINYFRNPVSGVSALEDLMELVEERLNEISIPTLVMQGDGDTVVNPISGKEMFEKIGAEKKEFCEISANNHVIVRGEPSKSVFKEVKRFLELHL